MTTARQFLNLIQSFEHFKEATAHPDTVLAKVSDENLKLMVLTVAETFRQMKREAERRGLWDELKAQKTNPR